MNSGTLVGIILGTIVCTIVLIIVLLPPLYNKIQTMRSKNIYKNITNAELRSKAVADIEHIELNVDPRRTNGRILIYNTLSRPHRERYALSASSRRKRTKNLKNSELNALIQSKPYNQNLKLMKSNRAENRSRSVSRRAGI
jgi:hypothetical protein